ncbi:hypothetical protein [Nocardia sp. NPDC005366]|uniref:hypothetical protein n=1 Tax=Nocardia sp. NPDC005366 TaxID=3156878 RepID=UPI0033BBA9BD
MSTSSTARQVSARSEAAPVRTGPVAVRRAAIHRVAAHRAAVRRCAAVTAVALTAITATVTLAPAARATVVDRPGIENASAAQAVTAITGGETGAVPDDFASVLGYHPGTIDGLLVNPSGDCSSPVPLPAEFDIACKAHDLGYDLLRYADHHGEPLGPWARQAIDTALDRRMRRACADRTGAVERASCFAMADIADVAVDLNSRRQHYGTPVVESLFGPAGGSGWLVGSIGLGAAGLVALLVFLIDAPRRSIDDRRAALFGAGAWT